MGRRLNQIKEDSLNMVCTNWEEEHVFPIGNEIDFLLQQPIEWAGKQRKPRNTMQPEWKIQSSYFFHGE